MMDDSRSRRGGRSPMAPVALVAVVSFVCGALVASAWFSGGGTDSTDAGRGMNRRTLRAGGMDNGYYRTVPDRDVREQRESVASVGAVKPSATTDDVVSDGACVLPEYAEWVNVSVLVQANPSQHVAFRMAVYKRAEQDDIVSTFIKKNKRWEHFITNALLQKIPAGGVLLDIGANIGYHSLVAAAAGYQVVSIEPLINNRRLIEATMCENPKLKSRITLIAALLGTKAEEGKTCKVYSISGNQGNGVMDCDGTNDLGPQAVLRDTLPTKTLETVLSEAGVSKVNTMKLDIEGSECKALEEFPSRIGESRDFVAAIAEVDKGNSKVCFTEFATKFGFRVWKVKGNDMYLQKV